MPTDLTVRYLPRDLVEQLRRWAPAEISGSELWSLERIAERIYAVGYDEGHRRGYDEAAETTKRPNINDVNELREALKASQALS